MNYRIIIDSGATFPQPEQAKAVISAKRTGRDWLELAVVGTVEALRAAFADGIRYHQAWDSIYIDEGGQEQLETLSRDLSEWSIAGDIVDHRDGTCTVLMGKPTEIEALQTQYGEDAAALAILLGGE